MKNHKIIYTGYIISKMEDALQLDHSLIGKYTIENNIDDITFDSPLNIDYKTIVDYTEKGETLISENPKIFTRLDPIKYKSHLQLFEDALYEFGKLYDQEIHVDVIKDYDDNEELKYTGVIQIKYDDGSIENALETSMSYKKENEAMLKAILLYLTDYEEEKVVNDDND